jgi:hypothetical protein
MKFDSDKACRPELIPAPAIQALGELYAYGATKYAAENWRNPAEFQRYIGGLGRHELDFRMGKRFDDPRPVGSGAHQMIAVAWNAITLYMMDMHTGTGINNMPDFKETRLAAE